MNHFFPIFANRSHLVAHSQLRATKTRSKLPHSHFRPKGVCSPMYTRLFTSYGPSQYLSSFPNWRQKSKKISSSLISVAARKKLWWPIASSISANSWAYRSSQSQETQIPCRLKSLFFGVFWGKKKFSWQNSRLSPIACHTYSESYWSRG